MRYTMNIYNDINKISKKQRAIAIGSFDGIHLGHQAVINATINSGYTPSVFTFSENPKKILTGETKYLSTKEDKENYLKNLEVEDLIEVDFSSISSYSPEEFFYKILLEKCGARLISCGDNFRFGSKASGDTALLAKLCEKENIKLVLCPAVKLADELISSTKIREALGNGDTKKAEKMLGRPFGFTLKVKTGNKIGRTLGTPTINQHLPESFVLPKFGVYASLVEIDGNKHWGVTNIGTKPTVGKYKPLAETWIGEFCGDLYGKKLHLEILEFIRAEQKFSSLEDLKAEIFRNAEKAKKIAENYLK